MEIIGRRDISMLGDRQTQGTSPMADRPGKCCNVRANNILRDGLYRWFFDSHTGHIRKSLRLPVLLLAWP